MSEAVGLALAVALGMNIGANNAGVHMAPAFGAGARSKWASLALFGLFTLLGSVLLGGRVVKTVGEQLFTVSPAAYPWSFLVLAPVVTVALLGLANFLGIPVPTTPVAICSLMGVGLALDVARTGKIVEILFWWILTPLPVLGVTWLAGRFLVKRFPGLLHPERLSPRARRWIGWFLTLEGIYSAFAIGSNNAANAVAPVVGTGAIGSWPAVLLAGLAMGAGALLWGGRVLGTVGKGITELCHVRALCVGVAAASVIVASSWFGIPVSGAAIVTLGILGFSLAVEGPRSTSENRNVRRVLAFWSAGPALAVAATYALVSAGQSPLAQSLRAVLGTGQAIVSLLLGAAGILLLGFAELRRRRILRDAEGATAKPVRTLLILGASLALLGLFGYASK